MSRFAAGLIGLVALLVFLYFGFTKFANPFSNPYTIHAIFSNANQLRPGSAVRIAGVNVGTVQSVGLEPGCTSNAGGPTSSCNAADVTMAISDQSVALHRDATFAIRPRTFLEGNFFVDVHPGTPEAPPAPDGYTFPIQQGTEPVQLDQVLTSLQANTRRNLQILLAQYGTAVAQGGSAYNASIRYWLPAYEYSSIVAHDALGIRPHDLSNGLYKLGSVAAALDANPPALQSLVSDLNTTAGTLARQSAALRAAVAELPRTLGAAIPAFTSLNNAFPPLRLLARTLVGGVRATGPAIDASLPFISQLRQLVSPPELRGLTGDLAVTVPALAKLAAQSIPLLKNGVRPASSCIATVIYPWSQLTLHDSHFKASNGFPPHKVYVEAVDFLPGLAGESRNFDANGPYIRIIGALANAETTTLSSGLLGGGIQPILGEQPALPPGDQRPPLQPNVPCETQPAITSLAAPIGPPPPVLTATSIVPGLVPASAADTAARGALAARYQRSREPAATGLASQRPSR